jgi:hypothetical protein
MSPTRNLLVMGGTVALILVCSAIIGVATGWAVQTMRDQTTPTTQVTEAASPSPIVIETEHPRKAFPLGEQFYPLRDDAIFLGLPAPCYQEATYAWNAVVDKWNALSDRERDKHDSFESWADARGYPTEYEDVLDDWADCLSDQDER